MALFSSSAATLKLTKVKKNKIEKPQGGREFKDYTTYKAYLQSIGLTPRPKNNWYGLDGYWQQSEREHAWLGWRNAVQYITRHQSKDYLKPFGQILAYYKQIHFFVKQRKHETRWLNGAYYLVEDLYEAYEDDLTPANWLSNDKVIALLKLLNLKIANYAITRFHELLFGIYKNNPLRNEKSYIFDRDFIVREQGDIAYDAYLLYYNKDNNKALEEMSRVYNDEIFSNTFSLSTLLKRLDGTGIFIPVYKQYYQSDLDNKATNFGQESRIQVPLGMLYPDKYFITDLDSDKLLNNNGTNDLNNSIPKERGANLRLRLTTKFRLALQKGLNETKLNDISMNRYTSKEQILYFIYRETNKVIMKIFN